MCRHVEKWSRSLAPNRDTPLSYITIILYIRGRYADRCKIAMEYFAAHDEWNRRKNQKKNNKYWNIESDNNRAHSAVIFCILFLFFFGTKYNPDLSAHRNERRKWKSSSLIRPKSTHVIWFHIFFSFLSCGCCYCVLLFRLVAVLANTVDPPMIGVRVPSAHRMGSDRFARLHARDYANVTVGDDGRTYGSYFGPVRFCQRPQSSPVWCVYSPSGLHI